MTIFLEMVQASHVVIVGQKCTLGAKRETTKILSQLNHVACKILMS